MRRNSKHFRLSEFGHIGFVSRRAENGIIFRRKSFLGKDAKVIAEDVCNILGVEELGLIGGKDKIKDG